MFYTAQIRLLTPFLGSLVTDSGIRKFRRNREKGCDKLAFDSALWQWAFNSVHRSRGCKWSKDAVCHRRSWETDGKILLYRRSFRTSKGAGEERFESLDEGTLLSMEFGIFKTDADGAPGPDILEFSAVLEDVGNFIGLSPWGAKFCYGRFELVSLKPNTPNL